MDYHPFAIVRFGANSRKYHLIIALSLGFHFRYAERNLN